MWTTNLFEDNVPGSGAAQVVICRRGLVQSADAGGGHVVDGSEVSVLLDVGAN